MTVRVRAGLPSLRQQMIVRILRGVIERQRLKAYGDRFQIVEYSIQSNHIHFILEAADGPTLAAHTRKKNPLRSGVSGFLRAFVFRFNKLMHRTGSVFAGRYHRHDLSKPKEVRNALRYVLLNHRRHTAAKAGSLDPYSSGPSFDGWSSDADGARPGERPPLRTWLLRIGWRRHGLLSPLESLAPD